MSGLRWQLLGPTAALCVALWLIQCIRIYHESVAHIEDHALLSAQRIHNALALTADSVAERDDLFRVWTAMAAEREISLLMLAGGKPTRVVIASKRRWIGAGLDELHAELGEGEALLSETLERGGEHHHLVGRTLWFTAPFELGNGYVDLPQGAALLIALDLGPVIQADIRAALFEIASQIFITLMALAVLWVLLTRRILRPLMTLTGLARGESVSLQGMAAELVQVGSALEERMARILEERARYDGVFEQATEGILLLHADGSVERANPSAQNLLNLGRDGPLRFDPPQEAIVGRDGIRRMLSFNQFELRGVQSPLTVVMVRDVTAQQETEALLRRAAEHAQNAARLQAEFVSTISHELRTPLTSIRGTVDLLTKVASSSLSATALELIDIAQRNLQRLGALIDDLLDLGKLESGRLNVVLVTMDLAHCLAGCVDTLKPYAERHGIRLEVELQARPAPAPVDADRYAQIVANLVSNAVKFSPKGAVVTVRLKPHEACWRTEVSDSGAGIPPAFIGRIFSKFAQADSGDGRSRSGTGLGLHISRSLAELMHGRLDYQSEPGRGSTFFLDLPRAGWSEPSPSP